MRQKNTRAKYKKGKGTPEGVQGFENTRRLGARERTRGSDATRCESRLFAGDIMIVQTGSVRHGKHVEVFMCFSSYILH